MYHIIASGNGDGKFLRGSSTSGTLQVDQFQGHAHRHTYHTSNITGHTRLSTPAGYGSAPANLYEGDVRDIPILFGDNGVSRYGTETRLINM